MYANAWPQHGGPLPLRSRLLHHRRCCTPTITTAAFHHYTLAFAQFARPSTGRPGPAHAVRVAFIYGNLNQSAGYSLFLSQALVPIVPDVAAPFVAYASKVISINAVCSDAGCLSERCCLSRRCASLRQHATRTTPRNRIVAVRHHKRHPPRVAPGQAALRRWFRMQATTSAITPLPIAAAAHMPRTTRTPAATTRPPHHSRRLKHRYTATQVTTPTLSIRFSRDRTTPAIQAGHHHRFATPASIQPRRRSITQSAFGPIFRRVTQFRPFRRVRRRSIGPVTPLAPILSQPPIIISLLRLSQFHRTSTVTARQRSPSPAPVHNRQPALKHSSAIIQPARRFVVFRARIAPLHYWHHAAQAAA